MAVTTNRAIVLRTVIMSIDRRRASKGKVSARPASWRGLDGKGGCGDCEADGVEDQNQEAHAVEGLRAVVELRLLVTNQPGYDDTANPAPVEHHMNEDAQSEHGYDSKLHRCPAIVAHSPKMPAPGIRPRR